MRYWSALLVFAVAVVAFPASARAGTLTLTPTADAFVRAQTPTSNFGTSDFLDSHGGFGSYACGADGVHAVGAAYGYLKFDLSQIPAGAAIESAEVQLTSRSGYAWDGDPYQHLRFVGDDAWSETGITYANSPLDVDEGYLASKFILYGGTPCGDPKGAPIPQTFSDAALTRVVTSQREGDKTLSLQVFNPNCALCTVGTNLGYWVRFFSREAADPNVRPKLVITYSTLEAPALYDAVPDLTAGTTTVVGRAQAAPLTPLTVRLYSSATCTDGTLGAERSLLGALTDVKTDADGMAYFAQPLAAVPPSASFVAAAVSLPSGATSPLSRCVAAPDNDAWPRARDLPLTGPPTSTVRSADVSQSLDVDGQARWYRIDVQPDSKVTLDLTGLPANYDLFVFKDIAAALSSADTDDELLQLSAEYNGASSAPSAFSPSAFSPSAFSPSAFSPSAFSPSAFSPSAFSPSAFSPSAFSPSAFSPSAFSPSAFSPSAFSPSAFSPDAYSSAQIRSLIAGSTNEGSAPESITLNSWNNRRLYIRVNGRLGASKVAVPYQLHVTADAKDCADVAPLNFPTLTATGSNFKTVILTDLARMDGTADEKAAMLAKLQTLAGRTQVTGKIVDLSTSELIRKLNAQADDHSSCPYAKNLVADAIKDIVDDYRAKNPLAYVVVVGNDHAVPFFRYPDTAGLGPESAYVPPVLDTSASQASLRRNYVLSQDAYGSSRSISLGASSLPVPDLPVGRLVESPTSISRVLDAYLSTSAGVVPTPTSSLVTGYDFLADAAHAVNDNLSDGMALGARTDTLITDPDVKPEDVGTPPRHSWTASQLRAQLLGSRHDLMFLAGHFSANNALAADYATTIDSTELAASSVDLTNSIVASAGCHSGYNIVDPDAVSGVTVPLDWTEAFASKGATLIAGTGYQYGDTDFLEYSERLYSDFARQLRVGSGAVAVGNALLAAKQRYLATTPVMRGIHEKSLLEATLYGLPMLSVDLPRNRITDTPPTSIVGSTSTFPAPGPGATLGLRYADKELKPLLTDEHTKALSNFGTSGTTTASWLSGEDGVLTSPGEPALPLKRYNVSVADTVLRGIGLRGATFRVPEPTGVTPLTGAATTEQQAVHTPFAPGVFFPLKLWSVNYFGALSRDGGATTLSVTPAQYKADAPGSSTDILRRFDEIDVRLYYSDETGPRGPNTPALAGAPAIADVENTVSGAAVNFSVRAVGDPSAGIQEVWVTYSGVHAGKWESLNLTQSTTDTTLWTGTLTLPAGVQASDVRYIAQAVNGVGMTSLDDNFGSYYAAALPAGSPAEPLAATLKLVSAPTTGVYRSSASVTAELTDASGAGVAGKAIAFTIGGITRIATTGANGRATASVPLTDMPGSYRLTAAFAGDPSYTAGSASADNFTITPLPATLTSSEGPTFTLTAGGEPVPEKTVLLVLTRTGSPAVVAQVTRITDGEGRVRLGTIDVPNGDYTLTAYFGGIVGAINLGDPTPYTPATASVTVRVGTSVSVPVIIGGTVPPTLALTLGTPAQFGTFVPGSDRTYDASTTVDVVSSAGDATLSVADPSSVATGRLVNGTFALTEPLQVRANGGVFAPLSTPVTLLTYAGPTSHNSVAVGFRQHIGADQALRTGAYTKTLTFTLSTTTP